MSQFLIELVFKLKVLSFLLIKSIALMERTISQDIDDSFEMCEPIVNNSLTDSMSIVNIPESPIRMPSNPMANSSDTSSGDNFETRRVESLNDGLPNYDQIQEQEFLSKDLSDISHKTVSEERNQSLQKLSDNLHRIEDNVKNCSNNMENVLTTNLETYLRELRDENENLKTELEKNNHFMKQQLKNLHEWQTKNKELIEQHKRVVETSKQLSEENQSIKAENVLLKQKFAEFEERMGTTELMSREVEDLRSRCQQMANYEKFNVSSELQTHEMTSQLITSQLKIDALKAEIMDLKKQLNDSTARLESMPAMESQLTIYERDFKIEEIAKLAALKEVSELEEEIERLKLRNSQLEEILEKGQPVVELKEEPVGHHHRHHRRHRRSGRL